MQQNYKTIHLINCDKKMKEEYLMPLAERLIFRSAPCNLLVRLSADMSFEEMEDGGEYDPIK